jgi:hypothetical protein
MFYSPMSLRVPRTLGKMIDQGHTAFAECRTCHKQQEIDIAALIAKVGRDYSLWNRRQRCKLTDGCPGQVVFLCGPGWPHLMADEATEMRWTFNPIRKP